MIRETQHDIGDGMVAILRENDEINWPYMAHHYAIVVDETYISILDTERGCEEPSDTYAVAQHIWSRIYQKAKEIQSVRPS